MREQIRKNSWAEQKSRWEHRRAYRKAAREREKQFPLLSCHPPYVSPEELKKLDRILEKRRHRRSIHEQESASGS